MLKGFPTWNVPLSATLNNLPSQVHENANPDISKLNASEKISVVKQAENFVLSACNTDGSVNVWNAKLNL
jgi:hypothetical protein